MTKRYLWAIVVMLLPAVLALGQPETKVRVTGQRVNLRAKANPQSEVIGQVADGDMLTAKSFQDEWVEVVPPETVDFWVQKDFLNESVVTAGKLNVRGGAGINYSVVGSLARGDTVSRRGEFGEWVKIAPPAACSLWVNRSYVQVQQPEKPKLPPPAEAAPVAAEPAVRKTETVAPAPARAPGATAPVQLVETPRIVPVKSAAEVFSNAPPSDLRLIPLEGQGRAVQREGVLKLAGFVIGRPSKYRLVSFADKRVETICFIRGSSAQLGKYLGQRIMVRGREYWVQGAKYPLVDPDQILPRVSP